MDLGLVEDDAGFVPVEDKCAMEGGKPGFKLQDRGWLPQVFAFGLLAVVPKASKRAGGTLVGRKDGAARLLCGHNAWVEPGAHALVIRLPGLRKSRFLRVPGR